MPDGTAQTTRQRLAQHTTDPTCATCHSLMDPLGFGFGAYSPIGAYQSKENGLPVQTDGTINATDMTDIDFKDGVELAQLLGRSSEAQDCFALQWFRFAAARIDVPADACDILALKQHFAQRQGNLMQLIEDIVMLPSFSYHHVETKAGT